MVTAWGDYAMKSLNTKRRNNRGLLDNRDLGRILMRRIEGTNGKLLREGSSRLEDRFKWSFRRNILLFLRGKSEGKKEESAVT